MASPFVKGTLSYTPHKSFRSTARKKLLLRPTVLNNPRQKRTFRIKRATTVNLGIGEMLGMNSANEIDKLIYFGRRRSTRRHTRRLAAEC